jgi:hypothetical protein
VSISKSFSPSCSFFCSCPSHIPGLGIHGESGVLQCEVKPANDIVGMMMPALLGTHVKNNYAVLIAFSWHQALMAESYILLAVQSIHTTLTYVIVHSMPVSLCSFFFTSIDPEFTDDSQDWWTKYFASTLDSEESTRRSRYTGSLHFFSLPHRITCMYL